MKHILIKTNDEFFVYESEYDSLSFDECNKLINGWIEIVNIAKEESDLFPDNCLFVVDEEGLLKDLETNLFATSKANRLIVGDVILTKGDGEGDMIGFDENEMINVMSLMKTFKLH
jgi:hypothetical protein